MALLPNAQLAEGAESPKPPLSPKLLLNPKLLPSPKPLPSPKLPGVLRSPPNTSAPGMAKA